jgi:hypothetical protein
MIEIKKTIGFSNFKTWKTEVTTNSKNQMRKTWSRIWISLTNMGGG